MGVQKSLYETVSYNKTLIDNMISNLCGARRGEDDLCGKFHILKVGKDESCKLRRNR